MIISINPDGSISPAERKKIDQKLREKGITTNVEELLNDLPTLISESPMAGKFKKAIEE